MSPARLEATGEGAAPLLLTPGPLTTAPATRVAMARDYGSREAGFIALTARLRARLVALAAGSASHVAVPLQGSGTFAVEATLGTLAHPARPTLALANGAYGRRAAAILKRLGRPFVLSETAEDTPPDPADVARRLGAEPSIADVFVVHCETTSGILNPLEPLAQVVADAGRGLIVDAMSSFGAIPVDLRRVPLDALVASSNKCLEGAPGLGFALIRQARLEASAGRSHSLSLDLHEQWRGFERSGEWRFTPPTQVVAALDAALDALEAEGGIAGRFARYFENCRTLIAGLAGLGAVPLLAESVQAPIIVTFRQPADARFDFDRFHDALAARGFVIYPGRLTAAPSFRVGCIGQVRADDILRFVAATREALAALGIRSLAPAP